MQSYKEFLEKHKKIVIPIAVILLLAILIGIICAVVLTRRSDSAAMQSESRTTAVQEGTQSDGTNANAVSVQSGTAQTAETQAQSDAASGQAAAGDASGAQGDTASGGNSNGSSGGNSGAGSGASAGTHTHQWVAHTTQVWVPNIVTVVDTPAQTVHGARFYTMQSDGTYIADGPTYWFENGFTQDDLKSIIREGIKNADENSLYNGVDYRNYQNVTKTTPAVTHTEDQGHYETQTDYAYCSICGQCR